MPPNFYLPSGMLSLKIAFRYLRAKKSHTAVNIITLIAIVGVSVATMAMVLVLSIFNGFTDLAVSQLSNYDPPLAVKPARGKVIALADSLALRLEARADVAFALPVITERGLLVEGSTQVPVVFKGVPPAYPVATSIDSIIVAGQYAEASTDGTDAFQAAVGVANELNLLPDPTTRLHLYVPRRKGRINPANPSAAFRGHDIVLSGVFSVNNPDIDNDNIIIPLEVARDILDYDSEAGTIEVTPAEGTDLLKLKREIEYTLGPDYRVLTRLEQRADSFRLISVEKWVTFMMLICILVITLFNVVSTLSLLAIEKRDNMFTLRALGAPAGLIRNIFIAEGFLVTVIGGAIGVVAGLVIALVQQHFHLVGLSADPSALSIDYYPVRVALPDLLIVAGVILLLAVIVGAIARLIVKQR